MIGAFTNVKIKVKGGMCNMCKAVEDMIKEETEKVEKETTQRIQVETIISMLKKEFTDEQILSVFEISVEQLEEIKEKQILNNDGDVIGYDY
jgi:hypothetical protein